LGPFALGPEQSCRQLLMAEQVPLWGVLELSTPDSPRFVVYVDGRIQIDANRIEQAVDLLSWSLNTHVATAAREFFVLHAGCLSLPGTSTALLLSAPSGSGKSSLTAALVQRGFGYLSDEFAPIDPLSGQVYPYPKPINLKPGSVPLFPDVGGAPTDPTMGNWHLTAEHLGGCAENRPCDVRYVILPRWKGGAGLSVSPLSAGETVMALAEQSMSRPFYGPRSVELLARLARGVRAVRLDYGSTADAIGAIEELIEAAHDAAASRT
jgi:hypothetical protein